MNHNRLVARSSSIEGEIQAKPAWLLRPGHRPPVYNWTDYEEFKGRWQFEYEQEKYFLKLGDLSFLCHKKDCFFIWIILIQHIRISELVFARRKSFVVLMNFSKNKFGLRSFMEVNHFESEQRGSFVSTFFCWFYFYQSRVVSNLENVE